MKRILILLLFAGLYVLPASAQIYISSDMFRQRVFKAQVSVVDSLTAEPVGYASVYLKERGDTVICNFTLTDNDGKAELKDITTGHYVFTVEFFGYKPFVKEVYFRKNEDFGTVRLVPDVQALEAATVSATANPIEMKQDTVIYNAAAFRTLDNAMLKDLLKKMPGFEVGSDGTVKHNGEELKEITVGGKKFFLDDKAAALNNLPAKVVDKVKVIDRESETAQFTGIKDAEKEKVMDIELKKEYKEGFFGNLRAGAGTNLPGDKKDNPLIPDGKLLYNANTMLSAYSEKDQLTVLAGASNARGEGDGVLVMFGMDGDDYTMTPMSGGLMTTYNAGANLNTDRIKDMETTVSANYRRTLTDNRSRSDRTTFREDSEDLGTLSSGSGRTIGDNFSGSFSLRKKDRQKYYFYLTPTLSYDLSDRNSERRSESSTATGGLQNSSESRSSSQSRTWTGRLYGGGGVSKLGKDRRSLSFSINGYFNDGNTDSGEYSETYLASRSETDVRDLRYRTDSRGYNASLNLSYVEPLAERWALQTNLGSSWSGSHSDKAASNADGSANDYFSSLSDSRYRSQSANLLVQYNRSEGQDRNNLQFGVQVNRALNETYTRSYGVDKTTGEGDWYTNWSPYIRLSFNRKNGASTFLSYNGSSSRPSQSRMLPVLDLSNPTMLTLGNIYLQPGFRHSVSLTFRKNNPQKQSGIGFFLDAGFRFRDVATANWFDDNLIQYSIPVPARKPTLSTSFNLNFNFPLNADKSLMLSAFGYGNANRRIGYQNVRSFGTLDTRSFDYTAFMEKFWGTDAAGGKFYSGESGFQESVTRVFQGITDVRLTWKPTQDWDITAGFSGILNRSRYSLDERANTFTRRYSPSVEMQYTTPKGWEFGTDVSYRVYRGYAEGYGTPECMWNFKINKNIKQFGLSFMIQDILNQTRNLNHSVAENYVEDAYSYILGRYFLFSFTWNFGKMNAAQSQKAQNAMWDLMF